MRADGPPQPQSGAGKLAGLDGLRALAVLAVLLFHNGLLGIGWIGVQIFFVLSGYLISRNLFAAKGMPLSQYLRAFYGRRMLRIFPLYFGALAVIQVAHELGVHMHGVGEALPYAWTYTYNLYHATASFEHSRVLAHFWSLSTEEQFYLVWPFVIYLTPRDRLRTVLTTLIVLGPALRFLMWRGITAQPEWFHPRPEIALYVLMPTYLDAFAIGALSALCPPTRALAKLGGALWLLVLGGVWVTQVATATSEEASSAGGYPVGLGPGYAFIWGYTLLSLAAALLIDCLVHGRIAPAFFALRPLTYLGKISYGIYVIHYPMQSLVLKLLPVEPLPLRLLVQLVLTVGLASASYHLFESRFLAFKNRWFAMRAGA